MNAGGISLLQKCPSMILNCSETLNLLSTFMVFWELICEVFPDQNNLYRNEEFLEFYIQGFLTWNSYNSGGLWLGIKAIRTS